MRSRYVTALLIVLTTMGAEASTIQSMLELSVADMDKITDNISASGMKTDIMSVRKVLRTIIDNRKSCKKDDIHKTKASTFATLSTTIRSYKTSTHKTVSGYNFHQTYVFSPGSIIIRGPNSLS